MPNNRILSAARHKPATLPPQAQNIAVSKCFSCIHREQPWSFCEAFDPQEQKAHGMNLVIQCSGHQSRVAVMA